MSKSSLVVALLIAALPSAFLGLTPAATGSLEALARGREAEPQAPGPFDWLAGHWVGEGLGGQVEEWWSPARAGVMCGTFRLISEGKVVFYELFTISQEGGTKAAPEWIMRLRHFNADLSAWEEKQRPLVWESTVLAEGRVGFGPVLYEQRGPDELHVWVELSEGGEERTEKFVFRRQP